MIAIRPLGDLIENQSPSGQTRNLEISFYSFEKPWNERRGKENKWQPGQNQYLLAY